MAVGSKRVGTIDDPIWGEPGLPNPHPKKRNRFTTIAMVASAVILGVGLGFWLTRSRNPGGDPKWGNPLRSLRTQVDAAIPAGATVIKVDSSDSRWLASGCDGSQGWTPPKYGVTFTSGESQAAVIGTANTSLISDGWKPFPRNEQFWFRDISGVDHVGDQQCHAWAFSSMAQGFLQARGISAAGCRPGSTGAGVLSTNDLGKRTRISASEPALYR